ncbi:MAG: hypothetical protein GXY38_08450 [Planctomycetes bacterium]|jgi:hypothetical protein|nr:hypothetical protein [Planctomycetota bacterium]
MTDPSDLADELEKHVKAQHADIAAGRLDESLKHHKQILDLLEQIRQMSASLEPATVQRLRDLHKIHAESSLLAAVEQQEIRDQLSRLSGGRRQLRAYRDAT